MDEARAMLESMIVQALENGQPLYSSEIVIQSEVMDNHILNYMEGAN